MPIRAQELLVANAVLWREWLTRECHICNETWLVVAKKGVQDPTSITYAEALDEALCFGWIDSGGGKRDDSTRYVRFTPRKPRSMWSARNVGYVERLEREGRMHEAGLAAVHQAKANGLWDVAYSADAPADLLAAVAEIPLAQAEWDSLPKKDRYALFVRLGSLPASSDAREQRIQAFIDGLQRSKTPSSNGRTTGRVVKRTAKSSTKKSTKSADQQIGEAAQSRSQRQTRSRSRIS